MLLVTNDFDAEGVYKRNRDHVADYKEICPHPNSRTRVLLALDVDRSDAALAWLAAELPPPNIVVTNPKNGHAHYLYLLGPGSWVNMDDGAQRRLLEAIRDEMLLRLDGSDVAYANTFVHNPFSAAYHATECEREPYTLSKLARVVGIGPGAKMVRRPRMRVTDEDGRNCALFRRTVRHAHEIRPTYESRTKLLRDLYDFAFQHNNFVGHPKGAQLPLSEIRSIARSAAGYAWDYRKGRGRKCAPDPQRAAEIERARRERDRDKKRRKRGSVSREEYTARAAERRASATLMRKNGMSYRAIGRELQCSAAEIRRVLNGAKIANRETEIGAAECTALSPSLQGLDYGAREGQTPQNAAETPQNAPVPRARVIRTRARDAAMRELRAAPAAPFADPRRRDALDVHDDHPPP